MLRFLALCGLAALLVGCLSNNPKTTTLPYDSAAIVSAENYKVEAARIMEDRDADPGFARVSKPRRMPGDGTIAADQWYVCLRGIPSASNRTGLFDALGQLLRTWFTPKATAGVYDIMLFYPEGQRPLLLEGFDLPLCRNLEFEFIMAELAAAMASQ